MKKIIFLLLFMLLFLLCGCSSVKCDICEKRGADNVVEAVTTWHLCDDCYYDFKHNTDDSSSDYSKSYSSSSFANDYGTRTTRCAHSGCSNYIASSGDTNCCASHSNRCGECNCYIDEDAMFCMDCLMEALD